MNRIQIVTDSTADIPAGLVSALDITVVPCIVYVGEQAYRDGIDLTPQMFYERLALEEPLPRTAQPPVSEFVTIYQNLVNENETEGVFSIHVAGSLSGTINAAWAAAQTLPDPSSIEIIDSGQLSMGLGWAVIHAARMARQGATRAEIAQAVRELLPRLRTVAMIDTLENLYQGGRINQISAALGTALQIKPLLSVRDGRIWVCGKVRTQNRALSQLAGLVRGWGPLEEMAVLHTGAESLAQKLAQMLSGLVPADKVVEAPAGPALTTHLGLGAVGVCAVLAAEQ